MMKIAADTPPVVIKALKSIDASKLTPGQKESYINKAEKLLNKFHSKLRPLNSVKMMSIDAPGIPQKFLNQLSVIDYNKLNYLEKTVAETAMKNFIKNNLPVK